MKSAIFKILGIHTNLRVHNLNVPRVNPVCEDKIPKSRGCEFYCSAPRSIGE